MNKIVRQTRVMETETIEKNDTRLKNRMNRNFCKTFCLLLVLGLTSTIAFANTVDLQKAQQTGKLVSVAGNDKSSTNVTLKPECNGLVLKSRVTTTLKVSNYDGSEYDNVRESKHFIFEIPYSYLQNHISPTNLQRWLSHLDAAYEAYGVLLGNHFPCNGEKLHIIEATGTMYGWAWVYGGQPYINWNPDCITSELNTIDEFDNWSFGILHEIGHLFDKDSEPNWFFNPEITANLKVIYAIAVLSGCHYDIGGYRYSLQDMYDYFYNYSVQDNGDDDRYTDKITLGFINVANMYGWNVFTQTFNSYWDNSYPNAGCNADGAGKYNEFINRLEYFSGSANIRTECFSTNNWQATIEQHYPNPSWQIGIPNAADVIASFNCSNGTLTISGVGAMQNWIYNNTTMPWAAVREQITSVVINEGVTSIGDYAFMECTALTVTLPNSITQIGAYAFLGCNSLTDVTVNWQIPLSIDGSVFSGISLSNVALNVPTGTQCAYASALVWKDFNIAGASFTVTPSAGSGGSISPSGVQTITCSNSVTFTATPNSGKQVDQWTLNGNVVQTGGSTYRVSGITANATLQVTFKDIPITYFTITATAGSGGVISPSGAINVSSGANQTFTFTPNTNYSINQVMVDGLVNSTAKANGYYTFSNVTAAHTISVSFVQNQQYTISLTSNPSAGGTISGGGSYSSGTSCTVNAMANTGYSFVNWTENGSVVSTNASYTFTVSANRNLVANFTLQNPTDNGVIINGVTWATRNVDKPGTFATNPESTGMFYQWNRKIGWSATDPMINSNGGTIWDTSQSLGSTWEKSNDPSPAGWRVPTIYEIQSLLNAEKVTSEWTTINGINGRKFTEIATGNSIFLAAAGCRGYDDGTVCCIGSNGIFWSSTQSGSDVAYRLNFISGNESWFSGIRSFGFNVRSVKDNNTGIENISSNQITVYPNPAKDELYIKSELQIKKVEIYSSTGSLLLSDNNFNRKITVSSLPKGIYLVKIYTDNGVVVSKIVKE